MPPTTAAYAERIEGYLKGFGIPATVSRETGEISVAEGSLEAIAGTDETRYIWTHAMQTAELKSGALVITPTSLMGQLLSLEKAMYGDDESFVSLAEKRISQWPKPAFSFISTPNKKD